MELAMVTSVDVMTLLEAFVEESMCPSSLIATPKETSASQDRAMEALVCVFLLLRGIVSELTLPGDQ
jgi:hypothetical protein